MNGADNVVAEDDNEDGSSIADHNNPPVLYTNTKDLHDDVPLSGIKDMIENKALSKKSGLDLESQRTPAGPVS